MAHVAIVGGGITGLSAAYHLSRLPDAPDITLFEATDALGGKIRTSPFAGLPAVDEGADAFLARVPWAVDLARELGLDDLVAPATGGAYVWWHGALHRIPEGLVLGVPAGLGRLARSHLLTWRGKARAALEPLVPRGHPPADNLGALVEHRFGTEVLERLVDPLIGSVNAGDTRQLSLAATAPQVADGLARSRSLLLGLRKGRSPGAAGPVFLAPRQGMAALVSALRGALEGVDVRTGHAVEALERRPGGRWRLRDLDVDAVLLAAPAPDAARLLAPHSASAASWLGTIPYASVAMVTLAFPDDALGRPLDGSGHLVPKPEQRHLTAASWASSKWTHWRLPGRVVLRASVGRFGDEHAFDLDDDALTTGVVADLERHLGLHGAPSDVRITRWARSFPQYRPGHLDRLADVERRLAADAPGVAIAGAAYRGLGIPACIRQGKEWAVATMRRTPR